MSVKAVLLAVAALLAVAPATQAAWYGGEVLDTGVSTLGGLDLERDGAGAVVYLKSGQVLVSRKVGGAWTAPEGLAGDGTAAVVTAGRGHRLAVAFVSGGTLFGSVAIGGETPQPFAAPVPLAAGGDISSLAIDMGVNGHAYVVYATSGGDVRAVRLDSGTGWAALPEPLDIDPARAAGLGDGRPRVATGADGHAIVVWGEGGSVWERRLIGPRRSAVPQEAGAGTLPEIDVEDDSSFVSVVWRGGSDALWRRLVGSAFEPPAPVAVGSGSGAPDVAVDGRGMGYAVAANGADELFGMGFEDSLAGPPVRIDAAGGASAPVVGVGELGEVAVAWRTAADVRGRGGRQPAASVPGVGEPAVFEPEAVLSRPELAAPGAPVLAADLAGNAAVAFLQGNDLVVADHDQPPGQPAGGTTELWRPRARPEFRWRAGVEPWGPVSFQVFLDGVPVATTSGDRLRPATRIRDGVHTWFVQATDRRGQVSASEPRRLRVDTTRPRPALRFRGSRSAGALVRVSVTATDAASGVKHTKLTFPDGSSTTARSVRRRFGSGTHTLKLGVVDRAGNVARRRFKLRIR